MNNRQQIKKASHIRNHYGSWDNVRKHSYIKDGVRYIRLTDMLHNKIKSDPECQQPDTIWEWLFGKFSYIGKKQ